LTERIPNYLINTMLIIFSTAFTLLLAEITFRVYVHCTSPNQIPQQVIHRYSENKDLVYELKPSFSTRDGHYVTNEYGMRDYQYSLPKPPDVTRICVLGDSVTFGVGGITLEQTYVKLLEKRLNRDLANKYEVLNFAVTGYNSYQEEILLKDKVIKFEPDIVLVGFCLNDWSYTDGLGDGLGGLWRESHPKSLGGRLHSLLISYLLHRYERKNFDSLTESNFKSNAMVDSFFKQLAFLGKNLEFDSIIVVFPYYFEDIALYQEHIIEHKVVDRTAKQNGLKVFDLLESWKRMDQKDRKELYRSNDEAHFSVSGMERVADELFEYLVREYNWS
jgi:lysophospholipase L1-like esterase